MGSWVSSFGFRVCVSSTGGRWLTRLASEQAPHSHLKRHLQAPCPHAKCHAVQVDRVWRQFPHNLFRIRARLNLSPLLGKCLVRHLVLVDRDGHHDLFAAALPDVGRQGRKAGVGLDANVGYVEGFGNVSLRVGLRRVQRSMALQRYKVRVAPGQNHVAL